MGAWGATGEAQKGSMGIVPTHRRPRTEPSGRLNFRSRAPNEGNSGTGTEKGCDAHFVQKDCMLEDFVLGYYVLEDIVLEDFAQGDFWEDFFLGDFVIGDFFFLFFFYISLLYFLPVTLCSA